VGDSIIRGTESAWSKFANYLTDTFKTQYGEQSQIFSFLKNNLINTIQNPQGFGTKALAALRGGAADSVTTQFQNASKAVAATPQAGNMNPDVQSGVAAQIKGQLAGGQAAATAQDFNQIALQDETLKNENRQGALRLLYGVGEGENPTGYASQATGAAGTTGNLGSQYFNTNNSGFFDQLGGAFAQGLGKTLSGGNSKGDGSAAGFFGF
jgi:hypothetical protein